MDRRQVAARVLILGLLQEIALGANPPDVPKEEGRAIDAAAVARLPYPGTVVPGAIGFTPDGKAVTYLKSEASSLSRVLWRAELTGGAPRVVARPPGEGDTEANVSQAEALRRERQRLRETGITQVVRAEKDDGDRHPSRGRPLPPARRGAAPADHRDAQPRDRSQAQSRRHQGGLRARRRVARHRPGHQEGRPAEPRVRRGHHPRAPPNSSPRRSWIAPRASGGRPTGHGSPIRRPTSGTSPSTRSSIRGARRSRSRRTVTPSPARPMPRSASGSWASKAARPAG